MWLAYGEHDRWRPSIALIAPLLPRGHVVVLSGGHTLEPVAAAAVRQLLQAAAHDAAPRA